ncbi:MAG TPA: hypothetical protein VGQ35_01925 [Dongiaceae bacterium]|jgi:hypothetical protein|nr:hypothetical protein [Dongiaceae bacterium]
MTDPKTPSRNQIKEKDRPRAERRSATNKPAGHVSSTDEDSERATERADKEFDPNVNQRPPR